MKTSYNPFEKGHEIHEKYIYIVFKNKTKINIQNEKKIDGARKFYFTNIKTVLQKYVPNKLIIYFCS